MWRVALLAATALVVVTAVAFNSSAHRQAAELEAPPRMVAEMEREARKDVENDATSAGLKALNSKDSLAATLTGGLKSKIEDMNAGDKALMDKIMSRTQGKSGAVAKASAIQAMAKKAAAAATLKLPVAKAVRRVHGRDANQPPLPVMRTVVAAVMRDRKHEMLDMSKALARVAVLKKQLNARAKKTAVHHETKGSFRRTSKEVKGKQAVVKAATAKALLVKSQELKKRAAHIKKTALFKALPKERALEAAMTKQKAVLSRLKKENHLANGKNEANAEIQRAKNMSQKSIQELKLAGDLIKQSHVLGSKLSAKQTAKLQKKSENLTEKAVHTMLESRKMSHKADAEIRQANAVVTRLPALETKARQSKLVLKVLDAQRKSDVAGLKHNKGYQAAVTLSKRLFAESHKDTQLAKALQKEEHKASGKAKVAVKEAVQTTAKMIKADDLSAKQLNYLRLALSAEKRDVEDDDSILSALSR
mmetsp:Transcript_27724/g.44610  ORF Transcript_27724/g.44610 Transcript_27724/m.44610 type:complete len:477 (+) Transcript_27724:1-1431(+)